MPSDDRERNFENALARHFRAGAAGHPSNTCSDAETLAAYHERSLPPEQTASIQAHLSACQQCQQIISELQLTDEIPAPVITPALPASAASRSSVRNLPARRPALWRWVAPAGALAAAVLVWVAVRDNNTVRVEPQAPKTAAARTEIAKDQPPSLPPPPPRSFDANRSKQGTPSDRVSGLNASPRSQIALGAKTLPPSLSKEKDSRSAAKKFSSPDDSGRLADPSLNEALPSATGRDLKSPVPGAVAQTVIVETAPATTAANASPESIAEAKAKNDYRAAAPAPQPAPTSGVSGGAPAAPSAQSAERVQSMSETVEVTGGVIQQQQMDGMSRFDQKAEMRVANLIADVTVSAPGGRISWRIGQAGIIQFSPDA